MASNLLRGFSMQSLRNVLCTLVLGVTAAVRAAPTWVGCGYAPASWTPVAGENLLAGRVPTMTGSYYAESGRCVDGAPLSLLTDGDVPGGVCDFTRIVGLREGVTLSWTFDEPKQLEALRISSRWQDAGRDGIGISRVSVRDQNSSDWRHLSNVPAFAYGTGGSNGNWEGTGSLLATLTDPATGFLVQGIVGLQLTFGAQDNDGAGYVEIEATGSSMAPEPRLAAALTGVDRTTASFGGELAFVGFGATAADVCFACGPADEPLPARVCIAPGLAGGNSFRHVLDNLTPGVEYAYALIAVNTQGLASTVVEGRFTTLTEDAAPLVVNEVSAADEADWFELFNPNPQPVDLSGWLVSDDPTKKIAKWKVLPEGASVPGEGYLVVYSDGITALTNGMLHVDIGLSSAGEAVALARPDGTLVDALAFPEQVESASYGWLDDGTARTLRYFKTPTPGAANRTTGYDGPTPALTFSEPHGYKTEPFQLTISCPERPEAPIYYTTDGTDPTPASRRYVSPLSVTQTTAIRACIVDPNAVLERESVSTYIYLDQVLSQVPSTTSPGGGFPSSKAVNNQTMVYGMRQDLLADPVAKAKILRGFTNTVATLSIVIDPQNLFNASTGIYVNITGRGETWERRGMVEQIDPVHGATNEFFAPMGLRMRGAASRTSSYAKHSFRLFFRSAYGQKRVRFPFFGDEGTDSFRRMDLRCSQNYSWANNPNEAGWGWFRDAWITETFERDAQRDVGEPYTRSRYYNLFINGVYWGLYQTQERADDHFAASYLGGENEDYDTYNVNELNSGTDEARQALYDMMMTGFQSNDTYLRAQGCNPDGTRNPDYPCYLDVTNLITRTLIGHYAADGDSPCSVWSKKPNNYFALIDHTERSTGFKWFCHDGEHGLGMGERHGAGAVDCNPVGWGVYSGIGMFNSHWLNHELMKNAEYKLVFADLFQKHFFGDGALSTTNNIRRFRARMAEIDDVIVSEAARWGRSGQTYATWTNACEYIISDFLERRFTYLFAHYRSEGWYPAVDAPMLTTVNQGARAAFVSSPGTQIYFTRDGSDPRRFGGQPSETAELFADPLPVDEAGFTVWARARAANGEWSALTELAVPGFKPLAFTAEMVQEGGTARLRVAYANLPQAAHLFLAWDRRDCGEDLAAWSKQVDLGEVAPGAGVLLVGAPSAYSVLSGSVLRVFLAELSEVHSCETLEYVRGDGLQRVALDYTPTASTRCRIKFALDRGAGGVFVGTDKGDDQSDWRLFSNRDKNNASCYLDFPTGARLSGNVIGSSSAVHHFEFGNFYLKDVDRDAVLLEGNAVSFPPNYAPQTYLFSLASQGSCSYGTVYSLKFYEGTSLERDYVPARDEQGVVCLYESVNRRYYYPTGGALMAGPTVGAVGTRTEAHAFAATDPCDLAGMEWPCGGVATVPSDLRTNLRVAEVMSVPVLGGSDGEEYLVLTNLDQTAALHVGGAQVTCTKTGDVESKCDFTLPLGLCLAPGGTLLCTKADYWPDGKITDGNVDVMLRDSSGAVVQRLFLTTKGSDAFRMCNGKGASFIATSFASEVLDESGWRPSLPDIDDKAVRQAVADAILVVPAIQPWLTALAATRSGTDAIVAYRGDAATLIACYLTASPIETTPEIELLIPSVALEADGRVRLSAELRQHGVPVARVLNGTLYLEHLTDLAGEAVETVDLGSRVPVPVFSSPAAGTRHFYRLRLK